VSQKEKLFQLAQSIRGPKAYTVCFMLDYKAFDALCGELRPVERIAYEPIVEKGYDNLVLDFPWFKIIAVLNAKEI